MPHGYPVHGVIHKDTNYLVSWSSQTFVTLKVSPCHPWEAEQFVLHPGQGWWRLIFLSLLFGANIWWEDAGQSWIWLPMTKLPEVGSCPGEVWKQCSSRFPFVCLTGIWYCKQWSLGTKLRGQLLISLELGRYIGSPSASVCFPNNRVEWSPCNLLLSGFSV